MSVAWAPSPVYGSTIALGPTQRAVLDVALRMTKGGRRPQLTLHRLSVLTGRPVSSVHEALGRLRALGLLGVSARTGRHGGHRLWRVAGPRAGSSAQLDTGKHRRAIARILRRFGTAVSVARMAGPPERDPSPALPPPVGPAADDPPPDPFGVEPSDWTPAPPGATFAERLRHHGLSVDWLAEHERMKHGRSS